MVALAVHQWAALALIPGYIVGVGIARLLDLIQQPRGNGYGGGCG